MMDHFDHQLDKALNEANSTEPLHGLEERIHERIRQRQTVRKAAFLAAPLAVCAALALAWIIVGRTNTSPVGHEPAVAVNTPPPPNHAETPMPLHHQVSAVVSHTHHRVVIATKKTSRENVEEQLPKLATFPAPAENTPEHRALIALATQTNGAALHAAADLNAQQQRPIEIAEIRIKPLTQEKSQ